MHMCEHWVSLCADMRRPLQALFAVPFHEYLPIPGVRKAFAERERLLNFLRSVIAKRRAGIAAGEDSGKDLLGGLIIAKEVRRIMPLMPPGYTRHVLHVIQNLCHPYSRSWE